MRSVGMFIGLFATVAITILLTTSEYAVADSKNSEDNLVTRPSWYPEINFDALASRKDIVFIKGLKAYQQTTEYTCGPAALLTLASFYGVKGIRFSKEVEMRIAKEAGTRDFDVMKRGGKPGTKPEEMKAWLEKQGLQVELSFEDKGDASQLEKLKASLKAGVPVLVEWIDLGGHWVIAVGFDDNGNDDPWDDVLILADSYDKYDGKTDGYRYVNANRFYWNWFDALYFDKLTWRTMITVKSGK